MATNDHKPPPAGRPGERRWSYGQLIEATLRLAAVGAVVLLVIAVLEKLAG
jgi:hypothetical protein